MNNNWYKKEKPLLGLTGLGGGVDGLAVVGAAAKTYVDDVFSTYLYKGTGSAQTITNGIDLSGEGGMTWIKSRSLGVSHIINDTVRGAGNRINSNGNSASSSGTSFLSAFNSSGFSIGNDNDVSYNGQTFSSWSFRKAPGFFDVVTWTGTGSYRTLDHSLGCIPGFIMLKQTSGTENWICWHRFMGSGSNAHYLKLNSSDAMGTDGGGGSNPNASVNSVSSTQFTVGADNNGSGGTWVAYLFAGGASTAATARGVRFDGSDDYLSLGASSDFDMGTGDFTIECWLNRDDTSNNAAWTLGSYDNGMELYCYSDDSLRVYGDNGGTASWLIQSAANVITPGVWNHVAVVRDSGTLKLFQNGTLLGSTAHSSAMPNNGETTDFFIGVEVSSSNTIPNTNPYFDGELSNFRVVKGTAVYTSSFRPPYEPLTNITNTKLLCCNNSSVTGSTVTPGTITAHSSPTATTNSPFDDSEGFKFGEGGDQNLIKTGSYIGTGSATHRKIELGFEPQWIMTKRIDGGTSNWDMADMMRGTPADDSNASQNGSFLWANQTWAEATDRPFTNHSTGFGLKNTSTGTNGSGDTYVYIAIRRPDGYVAKPVEAGTDAFTMDTGNGSSTIPTFDSGFPVDFSLNRAPATTNNWTAGARLIQGKYLETNDTQDEAAWSPMVYDSNVGWNNYSSYNSSYQSWMWKRHAGMDVVCWTGNGSARKIPHSLSKTPEMIWVKKRLVDTSNWPVYHKGFNGGTNPEQYFCNLDETSAENTNSGLWNNIAPTSTHFSLGTSNSVSENTHTYIAFLFSSVTGISKVGSYTGNGGTQTITTGFQPRFIIIKRRDSTGAWYVIDTVRGWGTGGTEDDKYLELNTSTAQADYNFGQPESNGFSFNTSAVSNANGGKYLYYAHA